MGNPNAINKIIKDYRKTFRHTPIGYWISTAFITAGFLLSGVYTKMPFAVIAAVLTAVFWGLSIWVTLDVFVFSAKKFAKVLDNMSEEKRTEIFSQYASAPALGKRWFLGEYLLFHRNRRIELLQYDIIRSAEPKGLKMELELLDGKIERLPLEPDENPAMIVAALRSKNPDISIKLNGQIIKKMENRKDSTE